MQITIQQLTIKAFKGIKNLSLDPGGKSAIIEGRNGTGKTTVFDAWTWLLFGKDSKNSANFDYKPLDENGQPRTGTDTEVEATIIVDGKVIRLRRVRHEKWVQRPGNPAPIYQGDETLCWIDDVPVKLEKDYQPYIASLIGDEERFKVLSIHGYFMRKPWKDRRKILVDAAGGDAEAEVSLRPEFEGLQEILQGHTPDEAKKRLTEQKKRLDAELKQIPARLDELQQALNPVSDADVQKAQENIDALTLQMDLINDQLAGTEESFKRARDLIAREREITGKLDLRKKALDKPNTDYWNGLQGQITNARARRDSLQREAMRLEDDLRMVDKDIDALKQRREQLLANWHDRDAQTFVPGPIRTVCGLCGQPLPAHMIESAQLRELDAWNAKRDEDLAGIEEQGKSVAERITRCQSERDNVAESLEHKKAAIAEAEKTIAQLQEEMDQPMQAPDYEADPEYKRLLDALQEVRDEIAAPVNDNHREELIQRRNGLNQRIRDWGMVSVYREEYEKSLARIRELEDRRQALGQDAVRIDGEIAMLGDYIHACCDAMEADINAMFSTIRWHLTDYLKDGTPVDCCVPYVNGVSYDSTLNNGAVINAGIEAIRVLSRAADVVVPCFVDNAEAVNDLAFAPGQMFRLTVSNNPKLTMILEG